MNNILVVGSANTDYLIQAERMPKLGETVTGSDFSVNAGGKGLNQAAAISKLGGKVTFIGSVGYDSNGELLLDTLKEYDVTFAGIKTEEAETGTALVTVIDGDNFIILNSGANNFLTPDVIEKKWELISKADYVVMQLEIPIETVIRTAQIAKENNTKVVLNPAPYKELPKELLTLVDILIPNEHEAEALTGVCLSDKDKCVSAVCQLKEKGLQTVIITLGHRGCVYNNSDEIIFCPAEKVNAVDTTSAGDSFIGALCVKLSNGESLSSAVIFANKASAIAVSRSGAASSIPYISELTL